MKLQDIHHSGSNTGEHSPRLRWIDAEIPNSRIRSLLETLGTEYPILRNGTEGLLLKVELVADADLRVQVDSARAEVIAGDLSQACRGIGAILAGSQGETREKTPFRTRGLLLEASRGAVMKPEQVKRWLSRMALSGYNLLMLYTKDTYKLPGEEYFGYLRGAYTHEEFQDIDNHAQRVGIEMVGCIQTLGHLEPVLNWPAYSEIRDTLSVMLTTEEKTYALIGKMLDFYSSAFASRRIHLGMDETHGLGRGKYMDLNGYRCGFDIYNDHLTRVMSMCRERGLEPMIWSDMYFRMGSKAMDYYDPAAMIPSEVVAKIPADVKLAYWDYYHEDKAFYLDWIRRHKAIGYHPMMFSGIWTWGQLWYNHQKTIATIIPCIDACILEQVDEIIFTMWGDDGGYCDFNSAWAGMAYAAERLYNSNTEPPIEWMAKRFRAICGGNYADHLVASEMTLVDDLVAAALLWDDPLLGIYWKEKAGRTEDYWVQAHERYRRLIRTLTDAESGLAGDVEHAKIILALLELKIRIRIKIKDRNQYHLAILRQWIAEIITLHEQLVASFRRQWYQRNKSYGFEVIQIRFAGLIARYRELDTRLVELHDGTVDSIPELDETVTDPKGAHIHKYDCLCTASVNSITTL
jgi:hypothetical protein